MRQARNPFTLLELLVVVAIIGLLAGMLLPALNRARERAQAIQCLSNLRGLGTAMNTYVDDNRGFFWPYSRTVKVDGVNKFCYFWGTATRPVYPEYSPFMEHVQNQLAAFWCPSLRWGSYVPQGGVDQPTTCYGYNAYFLAPLNEPAKRKRITDIRSPSELFVFNDSAMYWAPGGVPILQNSTYLEPISGSQMVMPTSHFRHDDRTQALCADGHAEAFGPVGRSLGTSGMKLSFVGLQNDPHYAQ